MRAKRECDSVKEYGIIDLITQDYNYYNSAKFFKEVSIDINKDRSRSDGKLGGSHFKAPRDWNLQSTLGKNLDNRTKGSNAHLSSLVG